MINDLHCVALLDPRQKCNGKLMSSQQREETVTSLRQLFDEAAGETRPSETAAPAETDECEPASSV